MKVLIQLYQQIYENYFHIFTFVKRDIKNIRVDTKLGLFWFVFPPLVPLTVFIGLASLGIVRKSADMAFVLYIVIGITIYRFMTQFITTTANLFKTQRSAIKNFNIPLIILIISSNAMTLFHLLFRLTLVLFVVLYYGVEIKVDWLLLPILFIFMVMFSFSIGVIVAFKNLLYRDYGKGMELIIMYSFFVSSVVFPFPKDNFLGIINSFNPFNTYVDFIRGIFYHGVNYANFMTLGFTFLVSFILFLYACNLLYNAQHKIKSVL